MSAKGMDVFSLRDSVVREYKQFATSFTTICATDIREQVEAIYAEERYWPEPLIQLNPNYQRVTTVEKLAADGVLDPVCADIFRTGHSVTFPRGEPLTLFKHQEQALSLASDGESYVVTTGTGSGKSLCFFIPIVHAVLTEKRQGGPQRTRAIVIYPMNALANSQRDELAKYVENVPGDPISFARYTGQETAEQRKAIADSPPDILLTNFMMLELLMTRQDDLDRRVIGNCAGLRFLVLDELHTYRGRQGADVALLVRRVRERLAPDRLQCIGTSATMASEGAQEEKNRTVATVASKLFAVTIPETNVIVETLERVTSSAVDKKLKKTLGPAIDAELSRKISDAELRVHPLAVWVETKLGITFSEPEQKWLRARPQTVTEAVAMLKQESGRDEAACRRALRDLLLVSSIPEIERTGQPGASKRAFFAFKLHQFISGAGHAFATLEAPGRRKVTVEGQQYLPGDPSKRLYPVHFCRGCGQEYHPVRMAQDGADRVLLARDPVLERHVAIKLLRDDLTIGGDVRDSLFVRMRHEARAAARVTHPNLVVIHDMGEDVGVEAFARQQAAVIGRPDSRPTLAAIKCPTLVLTGDRDNTIPNALSVEMAKGIAGAKLVILQDCGHLPQPEQPEATADALVEWLRS